jgi:hypothetical protein
MLFSRCYTKLNATITQEHLRQRNILSVNDPILVNGMHFSEETFPLNVGIELAIDQISVSFNTSLS